MVRLVRPAFTHPFATLRLPLSHPRPPAPCGAAHQPSAHHSAPTTALSSPCTFPLPLALCSMLSALCPMPSALCPMPYALCSLPYALCPMPFFPLYLPREIF